MDMLLYNIFVLIIMLMNVYREYFVINVGRKRMI